MLLIRWPSSMSESNNFWLNWSSKVIRLFPWNLQVYAKSGNHNSPSISQLCSHISAECQKSSLVKIYTTLITIASSTISSTLLSCSAKSWVAKKVLSSNGESWYLLFSREEKLKVFLRINVVFWEYWMNVFQWKGQGTVPCETKGTSIQTEPTNN